MILNIEAYNIITKKFLLRIGKDERKGENLMAGYIENVNSYLSGMKIKQTYLSLKSGIEVKKLSRILTGVQDITSTDMEKIASALGKKTEFFFGEDIEVPDIKKFESEKISFYAGNPTKEQEKIADELLCFMENVDEILSAKERFLKIAEE